MERRASLFAEFARHRAAALAYLRIVADEHGMARFEDLDLTLHAEVGGLSVSAPIAASAAALIFSAPAGNGHPELPEARRQLAIVLADSCTITASGETRTGRPGDLLLTDHGTKPSWLAHVDVHRLPVHIPPTAEWLAVPHGRLLDHIPEETA